MTQYDTSLPLVSVVVPSFNNAPFIDETMQSILGQTYRNLEVIIGDHDSTDGTWEQLQRYGSDRRVSLHQSPPGGGAGRNWRFVTSLASGTYMKLVCGDDVLAPNCVTEQVAAMEATGAIMSASRRDVITADGRTVLRSWGLANAIGHLDGPTVVRRSVRQGTNIFGEPACVLLRREALDHAGTWDDTHPYVLDQHTYSRALMLGSFVGLPESLAKFRLSNSQWSLRLAREQLTQVTSMHRNLASEFPTLLNHSDLWIGSGRARLLSAARRLTYRALSRQMQIPTPVPGRHQSEVFG